MIFVPKKISELEKKKMIDSFINGKTINELSEQYNCTKMTITRHLKSVISKDKFKELNARKNDHSNKSNKDLIKDHKDESISGFKEVGLDAKQDQIDSSFIEIAPLEYQIENSIQKDFASVPIADVELPKVVFMIVDKKIELETKYLREYPDWNFLSQEELNRKTIEIYFDLKVAKRFCHKEQKVIKVPNTGVFKIVAPLLLERGISRIVSADKLIAL